MPSRKPITVTYIDRTCAVGGATWNLIQVAGYADPQRLRYTLLTLRPTAVSDWLARRGVPVRCSGETADWGRWLSDQVDDLRPDVLDHAYRFEVPRATFAKRAKIFAHAQGAALTWLTHPDVVPCVAGVIAVSRELAQALPQYAGRLTVIPTPVDCDAYDAARTGREQARAALKVGPGEMVVAWSGRMSAPEKDLPCLQRVIERLSPGGTRFLLLGSFGGYRAEGDVQLAIEFCPFAVRHRLLWPGMVEPWRVPGYLAAADVYLHTSASEGLPLAIVEAMAAGLPIVTTDAGGCAEALGLEADCTADTHIVRNGSGSVCRIGDDQALADEVQHYAQLEPVARAAIGERNRRIARQEFDVRVCAERHVAAYRRAL